MKEMTIIPFKNVLLSKGISSTTPVIVFCDPGVDDALMLLQLLRSPMKFPIHGIIPVRGNASSEICLENTLALCEHVRRKDVLVFQGKKEKFKGVSIYGKRGMNSLILPSAKKIKVEKMRGINFACEALKKQKMLIISTAGLTEPAEVFIRLHQVFPEAIKNVLGISLMGGVINTSQEANFPVFGKRISEANVADNPIATKIVFDLARQHKIPIFLSSLDLTHSVLVSRSDIRELRLRKNRLAKSAYTLIANVPKHYQKRFGKGPDKQYRQPLHDVHATSCLLHPELYQGNWVDLEISPHIRPHHFRIKKENTGNVFLLSLPVFHRQKFIEAIVSDYSNFDSQKSL